MKKVRKAQRPAIIVLLASLLIMGLASGSTATDNGLLDGVDVNGSVEFEGFSELAMTHGAALLQPEKLSALRLEADQITIEHQWERGYDVRPDLSLTKVVTDRDKDTIVLDQTVVDFDRFREKDAVALVFSNSDDDQKRFSLHTLEGWSMTSEKDVDVVGVGMPDRSANTDEEEITKFHYNQNGPTLKSTSKGFIRADGDFSLFIHDAVIDAKGTNRDWSDWTGYWDKDPGAPTAEYEFRVTTIHVQNGTFLTSLEKQVELYTPTLSGDLEGDLTAPSVTGRLLDENSIHFFDDDHMHLQGSGTVVFDATKDEKSKQSGLMLTPSGDFQIRGSSFIEQTDDQGPWSGWPMFLSAGGLLLASATTAGLARRGYLPAPTDDFKARWHALWMRRGQEASNQRRYGKAARYYHTATRVDDQEPLGWYEWAHAELLNQNFDTVNKIATKAEKVPGMDRVDLLDLRASAAWNMEEFAAFQELLVEIARVEPGIARGLLKEHNVDFKSLNDQLLKMVRHSGTEGEYIGYS